MFNPRKKSHEPRDGELVASAAIDLTRAHDASLLRTVLSHGRTKAEAAWRWYGDIGEVHYAISRSARVAGYSKLVPYKLDKNGAIDRSIDGGMEAEICSMIGSPYGGLRGLIERYFTCMKVPGDTFLIRCVDANGALEGYDFVSSDELSVGDLGKRNGAGVEGPIVIKRITHPASGSNGATEMEIRAQDFLGRVWRPSARFVEVADSPMFALDTNCELLHLLTIGLRGKLLSRLSLNGILFVPSEMQEIQSTGAANATAGDKRTVTSRLTDRLITAATYNVLNYANAESAVPIVVSGPGVHGEALRWIMQDSQLYETDMRLRQELIDRILQGLDVTPSAVKGQGDQNHWGAWAAEDDERRVNIQPDLETMCWALTRMILHAEMQARNAKPGRILSTTLWYDLTPANISTNQAEDGRQAYDRNLVGPAGTRKMMNVPESDAPTEIESIRLYGFKNGDPYLATYKMGEQDEIDWEKVGKGKPATGPAADSPAPPAKVGPGTKTGARSKPSETNTPRTQRPAA